MTSVQVPCYSYPKFKGEVGLFEKWKEQIGEKRSIEHIVEEIIQGYTEIGFC